MLLGQWEFWELHVLMEWRELLELQVLLGLWELELQVLLGWWELQVLLG